MAIIECSCRGENENCFKCSGSGKYDPEADAQDILKNTLKSAGFSIGTPGTLRQPEKGKNAKKKRIEITENPLPPKSQPPERKPRRPIKTVRKGGDVAPETSYLPSYLRYKEASEKPLRQMVPNPRTTPHTENRQAHSLHFFFMGVQCHVTYALTSLTGEEAAMTAHELLSKRRRLVKRASQRGVRRVKVVLHSIIHGMLEVSNGKRAERFGLFRDLEPMTLNQAFLSSVFFSSFSTPDPAQGATRKKQGRRFVKQTLAKNVEPTMGDSLKNAGNYWGKEEERRQDASRDYWKLRDQNGQFGSYPSHDDYDE